MAIESGKINIRFPHFAQMIKEDTAFSAPKYDTPFQMSEATSLTRTPTIQNVPAYGDGIIVENYSGTPGGSLALGIHALPLDVAQKIYGAQFDANGVFLSCSGDIPKYGALMFEAQKGNGKTIWTVLYKVQFQQPEMSLNTKTETVTWQQPTLNATYMARMDFYVTPDGTRHNLIYGDYDEENPLFEQTIAENWYKEVYEPKVPNQISVSGITLDKTTATISVGDTQQLIETIVPSNADNKNVTWSSTDDTVATVDTSGLVTGISAGDAVITIKTIDGDFEAGCDITVNP